MPERTPVKDANTQAVALVNAARAEGKAKARRAREHQMFRNVRAKMDAAGMGL